MNTEQFLDDYYDDIVMEYGVSYDTARMLMFAWLCGLNHWKLNELVEFILND